MTQESERERSELQEMVIRGTRFRDDYDFEMYGEPVTAVLRPLPDDEFLPIAGLLARHFELEGEDVERDEAVSEAIDNVEEAKEGEEETIDVTKLDDEFVGIMQEAAALGIEGSYVDGEEVEYSQDEVDEMVSQMLGGYSVEIGARVLEISGDVRDAEKFRGGRGSVERSRDS